MLGYIRVVSLWRNKRKTIIFPWFCHANSGWNEPLVELGKREGKPRTPRKMPMPAGMTQTVRSSGCNLQLVRVSRAPILRMDGRMDTSNYRPLPIHETTLRRRQKLPCGGTAWQGKSTSLLLPRTHDLSWKKQFSGTLVGAGFVTLPVLAITLGACNKSFEGNKIPAEPHTLSIEVLVKANNNLE